MELRSNKKKKILLAKRSCSGEAGSSDQRKRCLKNLKDHHCSFSVFLARGNSSGIFDHDHDHDFEESGRGMPRPYELAGWKTRHMDEMGDRNVPPP